MERTFEEEVLERLSRMEANMINRAELCVIHKTDLASVKKDIDGNGKPGLKAELADLKTTVSGLMLRVAIYSGVGVFIGGAIVTVIAARIGGR